MKLEAQCAIVNIASIQSGMALPGRSHYAPSKRGVEALSRNMKRAGEPDEIAKAVVFFASDDASYVTGQCSYVDGGWIVT